MNFLPASKDERFKKWPEGWPPKDYFVDQHKVSLAQYKEFEQLVYSRASETQIESFLSRNKEVLALTIFLFCTGHHASWVYPKQQIRPASGDVSGLIPDYVLAGASSDGVSWFVLELKGADKDAFRTHGKRVCLSREANEGVCQLINYIDVSSRSQAYLRDELKLSGYREPCGILLIGIDEESDDEQVCIFKGAWNRLNTQVQIRSYGAVLRIVKEKIDFKNKG